MSHLPMVQRRYVTIPPTFLLACYRVTSATIIDLLRETHLPDSVFWRRLTSRRPYSPNLAEDEFPEFAILLDPSVDELEALPALPWALSSTSFRSPLGSPRGDPEEA